MTIFKPINSNRLASAISPTPYPDVNTILHELLASVQTILGEHLVGVYLHGSLANGDFDEDSDIDVIVVMDAALSDGLFAALDAMHAQIAAGDSRWAMQLEVSYIPQRALRRHDPADLLHPHMDRGSGERLHWMRHESDWVVQRHILRERGIALVGPAPPSLVDPLSPDDLRRAVLPIVPLWCVPMLTDTTVLQKRGYQSFIVLSLCRILYTVEHGTIVSKRVAARWAMDTLDARWAPLIERAWVGRQQPSAPADVDDVNETLDMIRYTLARVQQFERVT